VEAQGAQGAAGDTGGMRRHGRLPWPRPDQLDERQRAVLERLVGGPRSGERAFSLTDPEGRLEGPFNMMLQVPKVGLALSELGVVLRFGTSLSDRVREIAILTHAVHARASFEWYAHDAVARRLGMTDDEIEAIRAQRPAATFDAAERAAQQAVSRILATGDLDDEGYARLEEALGTEGTLELILMLGYFTTLALAIRVLRTPLPEGVPDPFEGDPSRAESLHG